MNQKAYAFVVDYQTETDVQEDMQEGPSHHKRGRGPRYLADIRAKVSQVVRHV